MPKSLEKKLKRGSGLATVLVITAIMVTLAFTVVGLAFNHLSSTTRMSNGVYAKDLAEAAIAQAIDQIITEKTFGTAGGTNTTINVTLTGAPAGSFGALTFDTDQATWLSNQAGIATWRKSINNLASDASMAGPGGMIPGNGVYLSAVGICQGTVRRVDAVVYIPKFPYSLASSGAISSSGDLFLAAVKPGGNVTDPKDLLPGQLATNSGAGNTAINFQGSNITVKGDVQSHSGATLGNATITGEQRLYAQTVALPALNISSYDTAGKTNVQNLTSVQGSAAISGYARREGDLICANGLNLDGGVVFVNGNLQVAGGLSGQGAVIVNGTTSITGTSTFSGTSKLALLSHGALDLQGQAGNPSSLTGIVYSDTSISAKHTNLRGQVVANDKSGTNGQISITQSQLFAEPVTVSGGGGGSTIYMGNKTLGNVSVPMVPKQNTTPTGANGSVLKLAGGMIAGLPPQGANITYDVTMSVNSSIPPTRFVDNTTTPPCNVCAVQFSINTADYYGNFVTPGTYRVVTNATNPQEFYYVSYSGPVPPLTAADFVVAVKDSAGCVTTYPGNGAWQGPATQAVVNSVNTTAGGLSPSEVSLITGIANGLWGVATSGAGVPAAYALSLANVTAQPTQVISFQDYFGNVTAGEAWSISLSDNSLIPFADKIRVLYWKEVPQ